MGIGLVLQCHHHQHLLISSLSFVSPSSQRELQQVFHHQRGSHSKQSDAPPSDRCDTIPRILKVLTTLLTACFSYFKRVPPTTGHCFPNLQVQFLTKVCLLSTLIEGLRHRFSACQLRSERRVGFKEEPPLPPPASQGSVSAFSSRKGLHEQCTHLKSIRGDKRMSFTTCKVTRSPLTPSA